MTPIIAMLSCLIGSWKRSPTWLIWFLVLINILVNNLAPRPWNLYHYYLGSKYFNELGYTQLYECTVALLPETIRRRDLTNYSFIPADQPADCQAQFSESRWQTFANDFDQIEAFNQTGLLDKGLNALPSWLALGRIAANNMSIEAVTLIDPIVLIAAFIVVIRVAGWRKAGLAALFIVSFYAVFDRFWGNFAQYVWLALSLAGVALVDRHRLGGFLIGLAAGLRIFPLFLLVGRDKKTWLYGILGVAVTLVVGLMQPQPGQVYSSFIENMAIHSSYISHEPLNLGLRQTLTMIQSPEAAVNHLEHMKTGDYAPFNYSGWSIVAFIPLALLAASTGLGLMFVLLTLSRYYYTILATIAIEYDDSFIQRALLCNALVFVTWWALGEQFGITYGQLIWVIFFVGFHGKGKVYEVFKKFAGQRNQTNIASVPA